MITIEKETCAACGLCAEHCPMNLIAQDEQGFPCYREDGPACLGCGHCATVCPTGALRLEGLPTEGPVTDLGPNGKDFVAFLKARRSVRVFDPRPVPRGLLREVLEAVRFAPSAKNAQPVEWTILEDGAKLRVLAAGMLAALKADPAMAARYKYVKEGEDPIFRGAPHLVLAHTADDALWSGDAVIAAAYLDLAATALGLGTCWSGIALGTAAKSTALKVASLIPEGHTIRAAMMIGYPRDSNLRLPARKPLHVRWA
jgi:nitroreductase/NAD-dependent dihydropyrimidine dehydrogenase PreA subunit